MGRSRDNCSADLRVPRLPCLFEGLPGKGRPLPGCGMLLHLHARPLSYAALSPIERTGKAPAVPASMQSAAQQRGVQHAVRISALLPILGTGDCQGSHLPAAALPEHIDRAAVSVKYSCTQSSALRFSLYMPQQDLSRISPACPWPGPAAAAPPAARRRRLGGSARWPSS